MRYELTVFQNPASVCAQLSLCPHDHSDNLKLELLSDSVFLENILSVVRENIQAMHDKNAEVKYFIILYIDVQYKSLCDLLQRSNFSEQCSHHYASQWGWCVYHNV